MKQKRPRPQEDESPVIPPRLERDEMKLYLPCRLPHPVSGFLHWAFLHVRALPCCHPLYSQETMGIKAPPRIPYE